MRVQEATVLLTQEDLQVVDQDSPEGALVDFPHSLMMAVYLFWCVGRLLPASVRQLAIV